MSESGLPLVREYTSETLVGPCAYLSEHDVVVRYVARGFEVPVLEQGGGAVHDPPSPRRIGVLHGYAVGVLGISVLAKGVEDGFRSVHAYVKMPVVRPHFLSQTGSHPPRHGVRHDLPHQRKAHLRLRPSGVDSRLAVEESGVYGVADVCRQPRVAPVVVVVSEQSRRL